MKKYLLLGILALTSVLQITEASVEFIAPDIYIVGPDGKTVIEELFSRQKSEWNEIMATQNC